MKKNRFFRKLTEWEFWPFHWVYGPIYPIFAWYVIRSRFRFFFSASNPTIYSGGFLMESKKGVYDLLPWGSYPATIYAEPGMDSGILLARATEAGMDFPLVLKPDIGGRGRAVVIAKGPEELEYYLPKYNLPFLVQSLVPYEQEVGIFFVKYPKEASGRVTGVVGKSFGSVVGDGTSTIGTLIEADDRLSLYAESLFLQLGHRRQEVLPAGQREVLVPFGNHARGAAFFNWGHLIDDRLNAWMNNLASQIDGFYFGRLDIRFHSWEEMLAGRKFSIIELNGAGSEPTHIYDPGQSLFYAWGEIIRHWRMLYRVSRANHALGVPYMSFNEGRKMFRENARYEAMLDALHGQLLVRPSQIPVEYNS